MGDTQMTVGTTTWEIDPAHSQVEFTVKHMMITKVRGQFPDVTGAVELDVDDPGASRVEVEIGAASIDTGTEDRDAHLRSADFLDAEEYPEIRFVSTRVKGAALEPGSRFEVVGELTIRGVTKEVTLDAVFGGTNQDPWGGERAAFSAQTTVDRRDFGLKWNQALETGGLLVGNEVRIEIEAQTVRQ